MPVAAFLITLVWTPSIGATEFDHAPPPAFWYELSGKHLFASGDDLARAHPEFDDSTWQVVTLPGHQAGWTDLTRDMTGWYRIRFSADSFPRDLPLAVSLGVILHADEAYLNGTRIGATGQFGPRLVEGPWNERLYRLPRENLYFDRPNVLAIRVLLPEPGGILAGPLGIGDERELAWQRERRSRSQRLTEGVWMGVLGICLLAAFGALRPTSSGDHLLFALFACLVFAAYVLDSRWFFEWEGKTPVMQRVYYSLAAFIPMSGFAFFGKWLQGTLSRITVSLSLTHGALGVFVLCAPYSWAALANLPWLLANVACYTFVLTWSFRAWRQNRGERLEQLPILTGTILSSTCFCLDSFSLGQQWLYGSFALTGMALYVLCGAVALVLRYRRLQDRVKQVTGMILSAHEDERKRVARDLHDGVGQLLQAVKLGLSMLNGQARAGQTVSSTSLTELVDETSQAIEEVRRVSMDLRPAFLERQGLIEAIQWYARRIAERTAIEVEVSCDELPPLTEKLRDHLYRIFQEALNNVVAHAAAQIIQVRLACSPTHLTLTIQDNGRGFSPSTSSARGVGLTSMRERIEILSGQMSVDSRLGQGTTLIFRVPVDHPR